MDYDKDYQDKKPFGERPEEFIPHILDYIQTGKTLDIGAGYGRNSVFLAQAGFQVTALDQSSTGMEKLKQEAQNKNLNIECIVGNVLVFDQKQTFDLIVIAFMLHHLESEEARMLIAQMKRQTNLSGIHCVIAFNKNGDIYKQRPNNHFFLPAEGELKEIYADWEILKFKEEERRMYQKKEDGTNMFNMTLFLLARKKS